MRSKNDFGFIFWLHVALIISIYISPFLLSWKIILLFIVLYYIQLLVFGNCVLTRAEFGVGRVKKSFCYYYLSKLGFRLNETKFIMVLDYATPWMILAISLIWQVRLGHYPLLKLSI